MKTPVKLTRRQFLGLSAGTAALLAGDALLIEPSLIKTRYVKLGQGEATHRLVQFSDVHHKGGSRVFAGGGKANQRPLAGLCVFHR